MKILEPEKKGYDFDLGFVLGLVIGLGLAFIEKYFF